MAKIKNHKRNIIHFNFFPVLISHETFKSHVNMRSVWQQFTYSQGNASVSYGLLVCYLFAGKKWSESMEHSLGWTGEHNSPPQNFKKFFCKKYYIILLSSCIFIVLTKTIVLKIILKGWTIALFCQCLYNHNNPTPEVN